MFDAQRVEDVCQHLKPLTKKIIRSNVFHYDAPVQSYDYGQALVFWLADLLTGNKLLTTEQLRLLLDEFDEDIWKFGGKLKEAWDLYNGKVKKLPVCKLGFLDRHLFCMDGCNTFLDIDTGDKLLATKEQPLEIISYNLTTLFLRYRAAMQPPCSAEQEGQCARS